MKVHLSIGTQSIWLDDTTFYTSLKLSFKNKVKAIFGCLKIALMEMQETNPKDPVLEFLNYACDSNALLAYPYVAEQLFIVPTSLADFFVWVLTTCPDKLPKRLEELTRYLRKKMKYSEDPGVPYSLSYITRSLESARTRVNTKAALKSKKVLK